ncbi:3-phosphoshikimate 1-carboxyvinyltransferase [Agromyces atrinae]|uniref:3-phosphoshikimate 1-carboxyvinyltransferase n=1 Tax=Agromyces atrinae TaxID=592376 RepID=A0A4Q2M5A2_9MICO|nr:3-phosphoshikimate 1-carboxyvinyltransferase [Agromyces atrinae]NYD66627.1 3-phosphoshikimate 1-carboxyvinyltransferase [Agromyces atrinae]RXZ87295.1 3-phosphoshikimate 1-carboxyvinyltransferase [Agromyces atrinae]
MLISKYSAPEFNPYGDDSPEGTDDAWSAPTAASPVSAVVSLPGSKSLTNRELVLAALADGPSVLRSPLWSRDSELMIEALRSLDVVIEKIPGDGAFGDDLRITPPAELAGSTTIDCGLAGTVMRFVPPLAGLALGPTTFDGDEYARKRPMSTTITSLRALGVDVNDDRSGSLPFTVHGTGTIVGGEIEIDASSSSQFVSGLLLSAARFEDGLHLRHTGERLPSLPHIDMTIQALAARGIVVESPTVGEWVVDHGPIAARDVDIEPDLSNAAPFLAAALVTGGAVAITGWPTSTTQVGATLIEHLAAFGADVELVGDRLTVTAGESIRGVELDLSEGGELAPTLIALATLADGPSEITGIGHIRHHETDRIAALVAEITGLGGTAIELEDGIRIEPAPLHGGLWHAYADHRIATAGALIGLAVEGVEVDDIQSTSKTLPQFVDLWNGLLAPRPEPLF